MKLTWRLLFCAAVLVPMLASAEPKSAEDWYNEGETQYNLGNFDEAAEAFKQGYAVETAESKKAAYLYNVAQAYRQGKRCKDAGFFYKRYLSLKEQDTVKPLRAERRAEIERWIVELQQCEKDQRAAAARDFSRQSKGTDQTRGGLPVQSNGSGGDLSDGSDSDESDGIDGDDESAESHRLAIRVGGGIGKIKLGTRNVPLQATFAMFASYPIAVTGRIQIDVGVGGTLAPIPYAIDDVSKTALLTSALGDVGLTYRVASRWGIRADVGAGVLIFSNMGERGNPFTMGGAPTTGALTTFAVRGALAADFAITSHFFATLTPLAFSYSPAKAGLLEEIKSIHRFDFMVGLGYLL